MSKGKFLDVLTGVSDDDSGSENSRGSGTDTGSGGDGGAKPPKRTKVDIDLERLRAHGYTGGPSVLLIPELQPEQAANWDWSSGAGRLAAEVEGHAERRQTAEAVTTKLEESIVLAKRAAEQQRRLQEARREEALQKKRKTKDTWKSKEKKKRDNDQQSRGKSTVEEEKRKAREFGVFSGFD